ncbi:MAG: hypothetical protein ABSF80_01800 [Chitinispirillaceae bacterium]
MRSRVLALLVGSAAMALVVGCAQVPHQSIHEAKKAIEDAQKAGAELYAPSQFKAAQVSFDLAMKELSAENRKLPFMRKYNKIVETLKSTTSAAQSAQAAVEGAKAQIRTETVAMINQTKLRADTAATMIKKVSKKNAGNAATLTADLDSAKAALKSANESLASDNLLAAKEKATLAQDKVAAIVKSLAKPAAPAAAPAPAKKAKAAPKKK